jgi:hypothetical protein
MHAFIIFDSPLIEIFFFLFLSPHFLVAVALTRYLHILLHFNFILHVDNCVLRWKDLFKNLEVCNFVILLHARSFIVNNSRYLIQIFRC